MDLILLFTFKLILRNEKVMSVTQPFFLMKVLGDKDVLIFV